MASPSPDARSDDETSIASLASALGVAPVTCERRSFALAEGRQLSGLVWGDGTPRAILLHGVGLNAHTWDATALLLGEPLIALDLPGHGDSSWREGGDYTLAGAADDVATVIRSVTSEPITIVGHSLGGVVATRIAATEPKLVRGLILVDVTPDVHDSDAPSFLREFYQRRVFASRDEVAEWAATFGLGSSPEALARGVLLNTRINDDGTVTWKHHLAELIGTGRDTPVTDSTTAWRDLEATAAPVTLIRGDRGFISEAALAHFHQRMPGASTHTLPGTHNLQESAFARLADIIRQGIEVTS